MIFAVKRSASCDYHRVVLPFEHMPDLVTTERIEDASLVVFNRIPHIEIDRLLLMKRRYGFKIIVDIDDYWHLYPEHYLYRQFKAVGMAEKWLKAIREADAVTTTNTVLASKILPYNPRVHIIPNAIPYDTGQFVQRGRTGKIAFIGGNSHAHDIRLIPGFRIPGQVPIASYMSHYEGVSVSLAPLIDNEFNRSKSNLKALEAGVNYAACIASNIPPFLNDLDKDVIIYAAPNEWAEKINYCKRNPAYVTEMGHKLGEHCREHYQLSKANELREELYKHYML